MQMISLKKYFFSTEGETEKWYLEHLEKLINKDCKRVVFVVKKSSPSSFVKRIPILRPETIYHFFDIESNSIEDENRLKSIFDEMKVTEKIENDVKFFPCYSNFTFELWMILHKMDYFGHQPSKNSYLDGINKAFNVKYLALREYKEEKHFKQILNTITLDDVKSAVRRAERIMNENAKNYTEQSHQNYKWFAENPATEAGRVIGKILKDCGFYRK